jgi:hypothetical protein
MAKEILTQIFIGIIIVCIIIAATTLILSDITISSDEICCTQNNATYIFYECQCSPVLSLFNGKDICKDLTCGSYCRFKDGSLIKAKEIKCIVNMTN